MEFKVTKEDILNGEKNDPHNCAVALSIKRKIHGKKIVVCGDGITIDNPIFVMPLIVSDFIKNFDAGNYVKPFSFELDLE